MTTPKSKNEESAIRSFGATVDSVGEGLTNFGNKLKDNFIAGTGLGRSISRLQGILNPGGGENTRQVQRIQFYGITNQRYEKDPRVKIKIPAQYLQGPSKHLADVGDNAVVFPYTPQIVVQTRANYNALTPTHSNYAFYAYQNSQLDAISIVGTFTAQNLNDANYMMASIHALRAVTKMNFGGSTDPGAPPPVCRLDGYGTYQFNDLPVVISSFFYTLNEDVDYLTATPSFGKKTAVPTRAEFTIECLPAFSRRDQASFSIDQFISGDLTDTKGMI